LAKLSKKVEYFQKRLGAYHRGGHLKLLRLGKFFSTLPEFIKRGLKVCMGSNTLAYFAREEKKKVTTL
jgi:hypothetical protein